MKTSIKTSKKTKVAKTATKSNAIIDKMVLLYAKSLNQKSKWLKSDCEDYRLGLEKLSKKDLLVRAERLFALNSVAFEKKCAKYADKLKKSGMFENMSAKNALD